MDFIAIVLTVCSISSPERCHEERLQFAWNGSLNACVMSAQPYIAEWIAGHPNWTAKGWRCEHAGAGKDADAGAPARPA